MNRFPGLVYIDSPIRAAAKQMAPFFHQGVFDAQKTPLFMRRRIGNAFGFGQPSSVGGVPITMADAKTAKSLPVRKNGAVFYGFNSQGNMHTVANRSYRHVLVLHGESNKRASARPAARLYDHVCLAGDLALERYLRAGIFHEGDLTRGRLIKVGDSFVQDLPGYSVCPKHGRALLYAPTWEGYGGPMNNYSSIDCGGMEMAAAAAVIAGLDRIVLRPHPYLGLLKPVMLVEFIRGLRQLAKRWPVQVDLRDANAPTRVGVKMLAQLSGNIGLGAPESDLALCLTDISAMEAVCLKAGLPSFIILKNFSPEQALGSDSGMAGNLRPESRRLPQGDGGKAPGLSAGVCRDGCAASR